MRRPLRLLVVPVAVAFCAVAGGATRDGAAYATDLPDPRQPTAAEAQQYENELSVRQAFGLSTDIRVVKLAEGQGTMSTMRLEIPLMPAEDDELERRQQTSEVVASLVGKVIPREAYAGNWIDNTSGTVVVAVKVNSVCRYVQNVYCNTAVPEAVAAAMAAPVPTSVVVRQSSLDELQQEYDNLNPTADTSVVLDVVHGTVSRVPGGPHLYSSVAGDYRTRGTGFAFGGQVRARVRII